MQRMFAQSPWRQQAFMGQPVATPSTANAAAPGGVTCEKTPEGGTRCSDGTYLPPGCTVGSPSTVQGAPPGGSVWPYVAAAGAVAAGAAIALSGARIGDPTTFENSYPAAAADLRAIAGKITGERAADAWNFSQMQDFAKKKYDLLYQQKAALERLAAENKSWEASHRNADALQAATAEVDRLNSEVADTNAKIEEYRGYVTANGARIMGYRSDAEAIIAGLPEEQKLDARLIIDPCTKGPGMSGVQGLKRPVWKPFLGQPATPPAVLPSAFDVKSVEDFVRVHSASYLPGVMIGGIVGLTVGMAFKNARMTRKQGWILTGVGTAGALAAALIGKFWKNDFTPTLVGMGGVFAGDGLANVINPAPQPFERLVDAAMPSIGRRMW